MKKLLILITVFMLSISTSFGLTTPRWNIRPIKVYIPENNRLSGMAKKAFLHWQIATLFYICFNFVSEDKRNEANITIHFPEDNSVCHALASMGCTHFKVTPKGFFTHSDIYIVSKTYILLKDNNGNFIKRSKNITDEDIYGTMLHEIGHAIGIYDHSPNPRSAMYKYSTRNRNISQTITFDDLKYLYHVYR